MEQDNKFEKWAKYWDNKLPNLSAALRSESLQKVCNDIETYDGWIRVSSGPPPDGEDVLVTDGKAVWIGDYSSKRKPSDPWSIVYNGAPPFDSTDIIAWCFKPHVPETLRSNNSAIEKEAPNGTK